LKNRIGNRSLALLVIGLVLAAFAVYVWQLQGAIATVLMASLLTAALAILVLRLTMLVKRNKRLRQARQGVRRQAAILRTKSVGKKTLFIELKNREHDKIVISLGQGEEASDYEAGKTFYYYYDPDNAQKIIAAKNPVSLGSVFGSISELWWLVFPIIGLLSPVIISLRSCGPEYRFATLQFVNTSRGNEYIWELASDDYGSDEKPKGAYRITVTDANSGKKVKTFKKKFSSKVSDFELVPIGNKVWVIGRGHSEPPVICAYDADNYKCLEHTKTLETRFTELETGIVSGELMSEYSKVFDRMYQHFFTLPPSRILKLETAGGDICYLDLYSEKLYIGEEALHWDLCLNGYDMISNYGEYIYYLIYENNEEISDLHRGKPTGQVNSYYANTYPLARQGEYYQSFFEYIRLEPCRFGHNVKNASILYTDIDAVCVLHEKQPDKYVITSFYHTGDTITEIVLHKYPGYAKSLKHGLKPYAIRTNNGICFRIKYMGSFCLNLATKNTVHSPEQLFVSNDADQNRFYSNPEASIYMREPYIIYEDEKHRLVMQSKQAEGKKLYYLQLFDSNNASIATIDNNRLPHYEKLNERLNNWGNEVWRNFLVLKNKDGFVIVIKNFGAMKINENNGAIVWKYEADIQ